MPTRRVLFSGHVQGVGFRAYVAQQAGRASVDGECWNRTDGKVEAIFHHEKDSVLDALVERLAGGRGRVDDVVTMPCELVVAEGFIIRPTQRV